MFASSHTMLLSGAPLILKYEASLRTFSLPFSLAIRVTIAIAIVTLDLDTEYFLGSELPKRLRAVPSLGRVRE